MNFVESEIKRLEKKKAEIGLSEDEESSLCEYIGRLESIEWEKDFLNGET